MKYSDETIDKFLKLISKEQKISSVSEEMNMNKYEVLALVNYIKSCGTNIALKNTVDDISMLNMGDKKFQEKNTYNFSTDESNEFKFIAISDTRLGSKSQQLSILNDIYLKGHENGYDKVFLCGNISSGIYDLKNVLSETNFINDTYGQIDYIVNHYPQVEGMKTFFITGTIDDKHLNKNKINIGRHIAEARSDMIYLGERSCDVIIDKTIMRILGGKAGKKYTVSYRPQQQIFSFRSEDKPDLLLYGGLLQMDKFTYRDVKALSIPSVCATDELMEKNTYSNTIGAWYITVKTNKKGELESVNAIASPYYRTAKTDYLKAKVLKEPKPKTLSLKRSGDK